MLQNKTVLKILSLLIAVFLWMYVIGQINPKTTVTFRQIPVVLLNEESLEENDLALKDGNELLVDIVIEGQRADLNRLNKSDIKATADVEGFGEGHHAIAVQVEVPDDVELFKIKTPKIEVDLEKIISVNKAVRISFTGEAQDGMEASTVDYNPKELAVQGPASRVNTINHLKVNVDTSKLKGEQQTIDVKPIPVDKEGEKVGNVTLSSEIVSVTAELYYSKRVLLKTKIIGKPPKGYQVTEIAAPKTIAIVGPKDEMDQIKSVTAQTINVSRLKSSRAFPIKIALPPKVKISSSSAEEELKVIIEGSSQKKIDLSSENIVFENLAEGLAAQSITKTFTVNVTGTEEELSAMAAEDFSLMADLEGYEAGEHRISVVVNTDKNYETMNLENDIAEITINEES